MRYLRITGREIEWKVSGNGLLANVLGGVHNSGRVMLRVFVSSTFRDLEDTRRRVRDALAVIALNAPCPPIEFAALAQQIQNLIPDATAVVVLVSRRFLREEESLDVRFEDSIRFLEEYLELDSIRQQVARSYRTIVLRSSNRLSTPINTSPLGGALRAAQADVRLRTLKLALFLQRHLRLIAVFRREIERAACFQTLGMTLA